MIVLNSTAVESSHSTKITFRVMERGGIAVDVVDDSHVGSVAAHDEVDNGTDVSSRVVVFGDDSGGDSVVYDVDVSVGVGDDDDDNGDHVDDGDEVYPMFDVEC